MERKSFAHKNIEVTDIHFSTHLWKKRFVEDSRNNQNMNQFPEKHTSIAFTTFTEQIKAIPGYDEIEN